MFVKMLYDYFMIYTSEWFTKMIDFYSKFTKYKKHYLLYHHSTVVPILAIQAQNHTHIIIEINVVNNC